MKRLFDLFVAVPGYLVISPLMLVILLAIMLQDGGEPYFIQERCGIGNTKFKMIKFRTMKNGKHKIENLENDPRVTLLGKFLRRTGMDNLPVLFNIIRGDMSFVGPCPMPYLVEDEPNYQNVTQIPLYEIRSKVKPGLTGYAQLYGNKYDSREIKFKHDADYIRDMSLRTDIKVGFLSLEKMFKGKWESK